MKNIDFLPNRYREQRAQRKSQLWRMMLFVLFGAVIAMTAAAQYGLKRSVAAQLDAVEADYAAARAENELHQRLQDQLTQAELFAELYTYLKHPWPKTQILAVVAEALPAEITLTGLQFSARENESRGKETDGDVDAEAVSDEAPPARRDLHVLRKLYDAKRTVVTLSGYTTSTVALHRYVARLGESRLTAAAELTSLESADLGVKGTSQFELRVAVRPGYGQPGGPRGPEQEAVEAAGRQS